MRKTLLVGGTLVVAAVVAVALSALLDLELESHVLLGVAVGAVVALVPDRKPAWRLVGLLSGIAAAWLGYLLRAGYLPDSVAGRAVSVGIVLALCVLVAVLSFERVPLWSTLLGAAAMAGGYEAAFAAAPPEVLATSVTAASTLLMTAALGFIAGMVTATGETTPRARRVRPATAKDSGHRLDEMLEGTR